VNSAGVRAGWRLCARRAVNDQENAAMLATRTGLSGSAAALLVCLAALFTPGFAAGYAPRDDFRPSEKNTTGLPTYPHVKSAMMDPVPRNTLGRQCTHYAADSPDPLETVEAWYRQALPGAVETDVNQDSIYGSYFKLTGIRLTRKDDFLTVYRMPDGNSTSIELFKCGALKVSGQS
jgi:hypothetical protein